MTRIEAPSRLHFGLLNLPREGVTHWPGLDGEPGLPIRSFGGVGLMIDEPGVVVEVEPAADWSSTGPLAERAIAFAKRVVATIPEAAAHSFCIRVLNCPPEHVGLGTGTALGLAVAKAIAIECGHGEWNSIELAQRNGRGERSAIGVHGFDHGGLIVEAGKLPGEVISPLIGAFPFPEDWRVLLFQPRVSRRWKGPVERAAIEATSSAYVRETETLCRLIVTGMLPAVRLGDLSSFGEAVYEFNARVGEAFAAVQGGRYADPAIEALIHELRQLGMQGVGQSSWGSTVFCIAHVDQIPAIQNAKFETLLTFRQSTRSSLGAKKTG